ncbi:queuosine biosynthesis protein QueD [Thermanaerovibrio velox DSM 12556]|jgi:6-pyruvoyltetrahydropterin/6-carboxytetrahydropterin synthase|uniref:6-carboxy-5,6,7,8-tetrahydropterin synthase n=1 Tax=Thermanaerovibrio velox DSM 12556 TaxID=926567 RepID=H0UQ26_9BACT|nr:6-carboxytetrahydropterin synthase QueD [Thermanaerovibrio velox]EHM09655.1 queuosine biosynthesis protein QueD [Thermanaerovibrio velox DSM 12556]
MILKRSFSFDAAHHLPRYKGRCEALHGHTYRFTVALQGSPDHEGMVMDFTELKALVRELVVSRLDHTCLNDLIEQPTAENIARWIFQTLAEPLKAPGRSLAWVEVFEGPESSAVFMAEDLR